MSPAHPVDPFKPAAKTIPVSTGPDLEGWEDDGGTPARKRRSASRPSPMARLSSNREQRDTASGCRARAAADLLEAATLATVNERRRMESSAASWTARAELLGRLEDSFEARRLRGGGFDAEVVLQG